MRLGVLTGGGDAPGLNAAIRGAAKTIHGLGGEAVGIEDGFDGLLDPPRTIDLSPASIQGLLIRGGTILGANNRGNPFHAPSAAGSGIPGDRADRSGELIDNVERLSLDGLIVIGGDGTLAIALELSRCGVPLIGVPKTIDNDLSATGITFGFDTAVETATLAIDKLHTTAESHDRIMYLEVMGRNAGWIAITSGVAGGADVILIPEIPFTIDSVAASIQRRIDAGKHFAIVVVAEGAKEVGGTEVYRERSKVDSHRRLGGIAGVVAERVAERVALEYRVTVLGHLQRGGQPTPHDRLMATRFGSEAALAARDGKWGRMVALRASRVELVTLEEAVGAIKTVPLDGDLVRTARSVGIGLGD